jgi:large subunit ribosomal protein L4
VTTIPVLDARGLAVGRGELAAAIAEQPIKQHLIHETVIAELAARRSGSHSTLTRGKVRGGGAKPWRQKGTGRARQGSNRSPQWTGGGIVFGPTPRTYGGKVNRKVRQQAFRAAIRAQVERGSAAVLDPTGWETPSTRAAVEYLRQAPEGLQVRPLLIVLGDLGSVEARSFRNVPGVYVLEAAELQTVDIVAARAILVERSAWERLTAGTLEVETVSPAPKVKPARKKKAPPAPTPVVVEEAEKAPAPKRSRAKKAAAPADEAPASEEAPTAEAAADEAAADEVAAAEPAAEAAEGEQPPEATEPEDGERA